MTSLLEMKMRWSELISFPLACPIKLGDAVNG